MPWCQGWPHSPRLQSGSFNVLQVWLWKNESYALGSLVKNILNSAINKDRDGVVAINDAQDAVKIINAEKPETSPESTVCGELKLCLQLWGRRSQKDCQSKESGKCILFSTLEMGVSYLAFLSRLHGVQRTVVNVLTLVTPSVKPKLRLQSWMWNLK